MGDWLADLPNLKGVGVAGDSYFSFHQKRWGGFWRTLAVENKEVAISILIVGSHDSDDNLNVICGVPTPGPV